ncbi:MAG: hypothetical protein ACOX5R_07670 [bacterium]
MRKNYQLRKERQSTRDRFRSMLDRQDWEITQPVPWYRQRSFYLPFLMLILIFALMMAARGVQFMQKSATESPALQTGEEMDYEEARRIFQGSSD